MNFSLFLSNLVTHHKSISKQHRVISFVNYLLKYFYIFSLFLAYSVSDLCQNNWNDPKVLKWRSMAWIRILSSYHEFILSLLVSINFTLPCIWLDHQLVFFSIVGIVLLRCFVWCSPSNSCDVAFPVSCCQNLYVIVF